MKKHLGKRRYRIYDESSRVSKPLPRRSYVNKLTAVDRARLLIWETVDDERYGRTVAAFKRTMAGVVDWNGGLARRRA